AEAAGLIVATHSGVLPYDGIMINLAVRHEHPARRTCRMLALDMFALLPFLAPMLSRSGAVRANPENAERLLRKGELVGVFPEGVKGVGKRFKDRYKLARLGRGGVISIRPPDGRPRAAHRRARAPPSPPLPPPLPALVPPRPCPAPQQMVDRQGRADPHGRL